MKCFVCDSGLTDENGDVFSCPRCGSYVARKETIQSLLADESWHAWRSSLSRLIAVSFTKTRIPFALQEASLTKQLVQWFLDGSETAAIEKLVSTGYVSDLWGEPIVGVARELGSNVTEARVFVEGLLEHGRIGQSEPVKLFGQIQRRWEKR